MAVLKIADLHVSVEDRQILKGVDLTINSREIHALLGPNGNGKSTLLQTLMGHPKYQITSGSITLNGTDIRRMKPNERSRLGLFLAMQYPTEISGITNADFIRAAINVHRDEELSLFTFIKEMDDSLKALGFSST